MARAQRNKHQRPQRRLLRWPVLTVAGLAVAAVIGGALALKTPAAPSAPLPSTTLVTNAPYTVEVVANTTPRVGQSVRLHFTVKKDGAVSDIYSDNKVLHYVISSANHRDFFHTFTPEEAGPGQFYLDHTFTQPGRYRIWTELVDTRKDDRELHHGAHAEVVSYVDLTVAGERATGGLPPVTGADAWASRWHVITERTGGQAGSPTTIRLHVEDVEGTILDVFPAEPAIYVMVGPNLEFFRHTHTQPAIEGKYVEFAETFPAAGTYLVFTETYVKDGDAYQVVQVPFSLEIQ